MLVNETTISTPDSVSNSTANESNNNGQNNGNENNNSNNGRGIKLITGNLVDEFGLETDLGQILGDAASLPESTDENNDSVVENSTQINNSIINNTTNTTSNETVLGNETTTVEEISILEFTLYSTDEGLIIDQVSSVTGLRLEEVKKLINFVYTKPAGFEDELIEAEAGRIEGIEKINGSVVIRLG